MQNITINDNDNCDKILAKQMEVVIFLDSGEYSKNKLL
jgi:hypothetical protein